jgi:hypothetical protein
MAISEAGHQLNMIMIKKGQDESLGHKKPESDL